MKNTQQPRTHTQAPKKKPIHSIKTIDPVETMAVERKQQQLFSPIFFTWLMLITTRTIFTTCWMDMLKSLCSLSFRSKSPYCFIDNLLRSAHSLSIAENDSHYVFVHNAKWRNYILHAFIPQKLTQTNCVFGGVCLQAAIRVNENPAKIDQLHDEQMECEKKLEKERDIWAAEMFELIVEEENVANCVISYIAHQKAYHRQALNEIENVMQDIDKFMSKSLASITMISRCF